MQDNRNMLKLSPINEREEDTPTRKLEIDKDKRGGQ